MCTIRHGVVLWHDRWCDIVYIIDEPCDYWTPRSDGCHSPVLGRETCEHIIILHVCFKVVRALFVRPDLNHSGVEDLNILILIISGALVNLNQDSDARYIKCFRSSVHSSVRGAPSEPLPSTGHVYSCSVPFKQSSISLQDHVHDLHMARAL